MRNLSTTECKDKEILMNISHFKTARNDQLE